MFSFDACILNQLFKFFRKEGLVPLVEYNAKKMFDVKLSEMKSALTTQIAEETDIAEVIETVKHRMRDANLPDIEVVRILWDVIMDAVQWSGKNQQQNANSALRQVMLIAYSCILWDVIMDAAFLLLCVCGEPTLFAFFSFVFISVLLMINTETFWFKKVNKKGVREGQC